LKHEKLIEEKTGKGYTLVGGEEAADDE